MAPTVNPIYNSRMALELRRYLISIRNEQKILTLCSDFVTDTRMVEHRIGGYDSISVLKNLDF
jgi:hypothetical protein